MRNMIRWRNRKRGGTFSGKKRTGWYITALEGNRTVNLNALTQASDKQFSNWVRFKFKIELDPIIHLEPRDREFFLKGLTNKTEPAII